MLRSSLTISRLNKAEFHVGKFSYTLEIDFYKLDLRLEKRIFQVIQCGIEATLPPG